MISYYISCDHIGFDTTGKAIIEVKYVLKDGTMGSYKLLQEYAPGDGFVDLGDHTVVEGIRPESTDWRDEREQIMDVLCEYCDFEMC